MMVSSQKINPGHVYALLAYFCWGFFPIYWKFLKHVPLAQILAHRVLWAFVFYTVIIWIKEKKFSIYKPETKKIFLTLLLATVMLMFNWVIYIYAINSNQIVEGSLGYFITPIVNILLGVFLFKEKLSKPQICAAVFAALGVGIITYDQGHLPWIALILAATFSVYGVLKKSTVTSGLKSNQFESIVFVLPALIFMSMDSRSWISAGNQTVTVLLLMGAGIVTGLPLIFFAEAAKRIPYYMMGFFQFLAPSLQFLCGVLIFKEPLSQTKMIGFVFIWSAVLMLAGYSYYNYKNESKKTYS